MCFIQSEDFQPHQLQCFIPLTRHSDIQTFKHPNSKLVGFCDLRIDPSIPPAAFLDLVSPRFFIAFAGIRAPLHSFPLELVSQLASSNSLGSTFLSSLYSSYRLEARF